jgi:hypothetical protein
MVAGGGSVAVITIVPAFLRSFMCQLKRCPSSVQLTEPG